MADTHDSQAAELLKVKIYIIVCYNIMYHVSCPKCNVCSNFFQCTFQHFGTDSPYGTLSNFTIDKKIGKGQFR